MTTDKNTQRAQWIAQRAARIAQSAWWIAQCALVAAIFVVSSHAQQPPPGSLKDDEVYGLTAFLLAQNELIPADAVMDAKSLPKVVMPARDKFVPDTRGKKK